MPAMGSLADVTLGDIARALARYRPVVVTVLIILIVIAVLPGPRKAALRSLASVPPPASAPADAATASPTTVAAGEESSATFDSSGSSSSTFDSASSSSSSSFDDSDFSSDEDSSFDESDFTTAPAPAFSFDDDGTSSTTSSGAAARPLRIVEAGWASATGATPLGGTGVPEGVLPVGKRIGQVDKYSFVRLDGEQRVLTLTRDPAGDRTTTGAVGVSICQITDPGWKAADNVPSDAAPKYDTATCVKGDPGDGTSWTFNLVTFSSPSDPRGFALVPTGDSIDYQVAFARS